MADKNSKGYGDYFKAWNTTDWKSPSFDLNKLFSLQRRNIEAFSAATQVMLEGAQAMTKRQSELMRDNVEQILRTSKDVFGATSPETNTARQTELAKSMYEKAISGAREISEMASKSSKEAFDVLNKRAAESLAEISKSSKAA